MSTSWHRTCIAGWKQIHLVWLLFTARRERFWRYRCKPIMLKLQALLIFQGRTGMAIAAYLTFSQTCANADESLKLYAEKRTKDMKGVTLPSQRRYVLYFEQFLRTYYWPRPSAPMFQWRKPAIIQHVRLSPVPSYCEGCDPYFHVFHEGRVRLYDSTQHNDPMRCKVKTDKTVELLCNCPLQGDIKVEKED